MSHPWRGGRGTGGGSALPMAPPPPPHTHRSHTHTHHALARAQRLEDICALERTVGDAAAWAALRPREREEKKAFLESQQATTRGFMRMAVRWGAGRGGGDIRGSVCACMGDGGQGDLLPSPPLTHPTLHPTLQPSLASPHPPHTPSPPAPCTCSTPWWPTVLCTLGSCAPPSTRVPRRR